MSFSKTGFVERPPVLDRLPPHSVAAEQGVLGCCLLDPQGCVPEVVAGVGLKRVFYDLRHQEIFDALVSLWDGGRGVDLITVQQELKLRQRLEEVGGVAYLAGLPDLVPSAANLRYYLEIVEEKFLLRELLRVCGETSLRVQEWEGAVPELLDSVEAAILAVNEGAAKRAGMVDMRSLVIGAIDRMEHVSRGVGIIGGIRTHLGYFDKMTGGLHEKELIVLAGRPSVGKTSLAMNITANVAVREKLAVGVFSMEMSKEDLTQRLLCAEAEVNFHKIRTGFMTEGDIPRLTNVAGRIGKAPIFIDDEPGLSVLAVRAKARRMVSQHQVRLVVIDYLQLMHSTDRRAQSREQEVASISGGLKAMAKELNVPVLCLAQLNRESAKNKNRKPQLEDLRESGAIEQDADLVQILYRPKGDEAEVGEDDGEEFAVNGLIAKQRNGPTGDVQYWFKRYCMKYQDFNDNRGRVVPGAGHRSSGAVMPSSEEMNLGH